MIQIARGDRWATIGRPEDDAFGLNIRDPRFPGQVFYIWLFESFGDLTTRLSGLDFPWVFPKPNVGGYRVRWAGLASGPLVVDLRVEGQEEVVDVILRVTNEGTEPLRSVWADACLQTHFAPLFSDEAGERCYLRIDDHWQTAASTPRALDDNAWSPRVQAYRIEGLELPFPKGVIPGLYQWSVSPARASHGLIAMSPREGPGVLGFTWEKTLTVAHNPQPPHHCIHAAPGIEEIWPGQTGSVRGRIYLLPEGLEALWCCYQKDFAATRRHG